MCGWRGSGLADGRRYEDALRRDDGALENGIWKAWTNDASRAIRSAVVPRNARRVLDHGGAIGLVSRRRCAPSSSGRWRLERSKKREGGEGEEKGLLASAIWNSVALG